MPDVVNPEKRSKMMAGIKGRNTKPELVIRSGLHARGFRFRLHDKKLPGKPDMVLPKFKVVVFVNGCFWHRHDCHLFKWPKSRQDFWRQKIEGNVKRDIKVRKELEEMGWRHVTVWECALKGKFRIAHDQLLQMISDCISGNSDVSEIRGK